MSPVSNATRWIVIAIALGAAVCFAIAVQGGRWWSAETIGVGPGGTRLCFGSGGECRVDDLFLVGGSAWWRKAGLATMTASLIATLALIALAGSLAAKRKGTLAAGAAMSATLTSAVAGALFLVGFPGTVNGIPAEPGHGIVLWIVAVVAASVATFTTLRRRQ
jgi:hypothetical protein